jgi:hypothetical protein
MTRTNDLDLELKQQKVWNNIAKASIGGLEKAVDRMGGEMTGVNFKVGDYDYLAIIKAEFPAGPQVCFVGGSSIGDVLQKAASSGWQDKLSWRPDRYRTKVPVTD